MKLFCAIAACAAILWFPLASNANAADEAFGPALERARSEAALEHPVASLAKYREALAAAGDDATRVRIAHFGIARMLFWLERYDEAHDEYAALLAMPLSAEDRDVALDGEIRSLLALDRPRSAYRLVPSDGEGIDARLALAAARAATEVGKPAEAQTILAAHRDGIAALPVGSRWEREGRTLAADVKSEGDVSAGIDQAFAHDNDGENTNETTLAIRQPLGSGSVLTYRARRLALAGPAGDAAVADFAGAGLTTPRSDTFALSVSGDLARYGDWNPFFFNASVAYQPQDALRLRASVDESVVETQMALNDRVRDASFGIDANVRPNALVAIDAATYGTRFSDGNRRVGYFASVTSNAFADAGYTVAFQARGFTDLAASRDYFSPSHFAEQRLIATKRVRWQQWNLSADVGVGRQTLAATAASLTSLFGLELRGPIGGCVRVDLAASESNSALASASGYRRTGATLSLACAL